MSSSSGNVVAQSPLPALGRRNVLVTSALPYVNNVPHLGNIVGAVLSADAYARYLRQRGDNCIYICGTDEYGTATEKKAAEEGMTPKQICDKYHAIHADVYSWFDCKFDHFGRTTTEQQTEIAQDIFLKLHKRGLILEDDIEQLFCEKCEKFQADRFVEGTCPLCDAAGARGDQCDACGHLLNAIELKDPLCKTCSSTPIVRSTRHLFLDLPTIEPRLRSWVDHQSKVGHWSNNAKSITKGWISEGLRQRCITRDLKWGTPVPLDGFRDKVFYVWFDAPIGYISITANLFPDKPSSSDERTGSGWKEWWKPTGESGKVELVQFMGKDNIPFHSVIFPSSLMAAEDNWTILSNLNATEYLNYEGTKFSKSNGVGVFGNHCQETGIPSEVWRYYLLKVRPESSDADFTWSDLQDNNNGELISNLGNFCNRMLSFSFKNFDKRVPACNAGNLTDLERKLESDVQQSLTKMVRLLDSVRLRDGLRVAMEISRLGNGYMQEGQPWKIIKEDPGRAAAVLHTGLQLVQLLAAIFQPFMPGFSRKVFAQLGCPEKDTDPLFPDTWTILGGGARSAADADASASGASSGEYTVPILSALESGAELGEPQLLFTPLKDDVIERFRTKYAGKDEANSSQPTFPLDIRGGLIRGFRPHASDDTRALVVLDVDVGEEKLRQIVGRLGPILGEDTDDGAREAALVGREIVVLCNLPSAELRGETSQGMVLVAEKRKTKTAPASQAILEPLVVGVDGTDAVSALPAAVPWVGRRFFPSGFVPPGEGVMTSLAAFQKLDVKVAQVLEAELLQSDDSPAQSPGSKKLNQKGAKAFVVVFDKTHIVRSNDSGPRVFLTGPGVESTCRVK